ADPMMARQRAVRRAASAVPSPVPGNRTTACPTGWPRTTTERLSCELDACLANCWDTAAIRPAWSRTCTSAPVRAARSSTGLRSAAAQELVRSHAAPAATVIALARLDRCRLVRFETSAAVNAAASPASSATAASATPRKAKASRRPSASLRVPGRLGSASAISGQPQAVATAQDRLHDPRVAGIVLDLAAQVLHVRVHRALIPLELVA